MYFTQLLTSKAHSLYLPIAAREDISRLVSTHQRTKTSRENTPFRRQVDYWLLCLTMALAEGLSPREGPSSSWGYKFVDTREVQLPDPVYDLLAVVAFEVMERDAERVDDPSKVIEVANGLAGAASPKVLRKLMTKDLRLTPLDKALALVSAAIE